MVEKHEQTTEKKRLEELRQVLRSESISYGELFELQSLVEHIDVEDVELLEAAGVPEEEYHRRYQESRLQAA